MISGINSAINFKNNENIQNSTPRDKEIKSDNNSVVKTITDKVQPDKFEESSKPEIKEDVPQNNHEEIKKTKIDKFKEKTAKVSKFFVTSEEVTKGIGKGTLYGGLTGALGLGLSWFTSALPKGFKRGTKFTEPFKHPIKSMNKTHKIVTATVAASVFVHQIVKAVLKSNQRKANIDHKLNIKHD